MTFFTFYLISLVTLWIASTINMKEAAGGLAVMLLTLLFSGPVWMVINVAFLMAG